MNNLILLKWVLLYVMLVILTYILAGLYRRFSLKKQLLDTPNHRSSHTLPTPRGGGTAFLIGFLCFSGFLALYQVIKFSWLLYGGVGSAIALLGFWDDTRGLSAKFRLLAQFTLSILSIFLLKQLPPLSLFGMALNGSVIGYIMAVFYLVWMLNLYNFMDGINGIAALEAITVCSSASILYYLTGHGEMALLPCAVAAAALGFLKWNFPRASLFMGDIGSSFLGFILAIFSLEGGASNPAFFYSWLIFLAVFILDATLTLLTRLFLKCNVLEAHCNHAYQHAARHYGSHTLVTCSILFINCIWLLPLGILVGLDKLSSITGLLLAYLPLIPLAAYFRAGKN